MKKILLTNEEKKLVEFAKRAIVKYSKKRKEKGLYDTIHAFVLSSSGKIYSGTPLESNLPPTNHCAEAHAISNMRLEETEKTKIKSILVAGPVPKISRRCATPCGRCRHLINEFGTPNTTVLCSEFIRFEKEWKVFPKIQKYTIKELYPFPYTPTKWTDKL